MLRIDVSPKFRANRPEEARGAAGKSAADVVSEARARSRKSNRAAHLVAALAILASPLVAYRSLRAPHSGLAPAPVAVALRPHAAPAVQTVRLAPQQSLEARMVREGIDFTATSATCATPGKKPKDCAVGKRKTSPPPKRHPPGAALR